MTSIDMWSRVCAETETRTALARDAATFNKATLFTALAALGVTLVNVRFDGYGDSGQIEDIATFDATNAVVPLPNTPIPHRAPAGDLSGLLEEPATLAEVIETMAYGLLEQTICGWEVNEGSYGDFDFDVATQTITLDYHERHMLEDHTQYEF